MTCQEIQPLLHAYMDGELDAAKSLEIEKHIHACPECRQAHRNQSVLKNAVSSCAPYFKAPAALRRNILAAASRQAAAETPAKSRPTSRPTHWQWNIFTASAAMAACLVVGFFVAMLFFSTPRHESAGDLVLNEITASHVRSLLATHLMDVVSTDQHTVKPWFDGKLDFAPPVNDFASKGYPLIGGRLDYIGGRAVAALVYKKEKHVINLFIWPAGKESAALHTTSKDGYNLVGWSQSGMNFRAVSDVSATDLENFARLAGDETK